MNLVGHSLAGSVSLQLQKDNPGKYHTTTYGAPVFSPLGFLSPSKDRFKHQPDPISIFDTAAQQAPIWSLNPLTHHSYGGYE